MPKPVGKLDTATLIILCILVLPVAWFALILAPIMTEDVNFMGVLDGLNAAMAQPFNIQWVESSPKYLFLFVGLFAVRKCFRNGGGDGRIELFLFRLFLCFRFRFG